MEQIGTGSDLFPVSSSNVACADGGLDGNSRYWLFDSEESVLPDEEFEGIARGSYSSQEEEREEVPCLNCNPPCNTHTAKDIISPCLNCGCEEINPAGEDQTWWEPKYLTVDLTYTPEEIVILPENEESGWSGKVCVRCQRARAWKEFRRWDSGLYWNVCIECHKTLLNGPPPLQSKVEFAEPIELEEASTEVADLVTLLDLDFEELDPQAAIKSLVDKLDSPLSGVFGSDAHKPWWSDEPYPTWTTTLEDEDEQEAQAATNLI